MIKKCIFVFFTVLIICYDIVFVALASVRFIPAETTAYIVSSFPADHTVSDLMKKTNGRNLRQSKAEYLQFTSENEHLKAVKKYKYTFDVKLSLHQINKLKNEHKELLLFFENEKPRECTEYERFYVEQETAIHPILLSEVNYE